MANNKKIKVQEIKTGAELLSAFNVFSAMTEADRVKFCKDNGGDEKSVTLSTGTAKVVFYPASAIVWVGFLPVNKATGEVGKNAGKFHSLALNKGHAAYEQFKDKEGNRKGFHHYTWTADESIWYTDKNTDLVKALGKAF